MKRTGKWSLVIVIGLLALTLGLIGSIALAQEATPEAETPTQGTGVPDSKGFFGRGWSGHFGGFSRRGNDSNRLENLAEALGITVQELEDAQERAYAASVADAVAAGQITQEQADQILAAHALKNYIDRQAILAEALGMTNEELETALADGQSLVDLMVAKGIDSTTLQTNTRSAFEAAVQQAVTDGVITQAQADQILSADNFNLFGRGGFGGHRGRGGHGGRGFFRFAPPDSTTPDSTTPETTDTGFGA